MTSALGVTGDNDTARPPFSGFTDNPVEWFENIGKNLAASLHCGATHTAKPKHIAKNLAISKPWAYGCMGVTDGTYMSPHNAPAVLVTDLTDSAAVCVEGIGTYGGAADINDKAKHTLYAQLFSGSQPSTSTTEVCRQTVSFEAFADISRHKWKRYVFRRRPHGECNQQ